MAEKHINNYEEFEIKLVWKDRKRILGMPITFTKYSVSDDRLFLEKGFFNSKTDEVLLYRIQDISMSISLWQKLFGVGSIAVHSSDKSIPHLVMKNIKKPKVVKEILHRQVEKMKIARKMRVGEILQDTDVDCNWTDTDASGILDVDEMNPMYHE